MEKNKYRGRRVDNKEWVYGHLVTIPFVGVMIFTDGQKRKKD